MSPSSSAPEPTTATPTDRGSTDASPAARTRASADSGSDWVIRAHQLRKVYRLYRKPHYKFLDAFGLLRRGGDRYRESPALDGIDLQIQRGEKVAIIGRNGAGKSTLLKLISGVIRPTSGTLEVRGETQALLQIGTGFHPEFTGRENVSSYLAHLGFTGRELADRVAEVAEFAELEEYIDQPVKTYSTGMGMRLMFAASTVISPELLVVDEVLAVGDAYFSQKSFDRIEELCNQHDTTLLLVTHDIYSSLQLCDRFIWIEKGRIHADARGDSVVKLYEESIRMQSEERLRGRRLLAQEKNTKEETVRIDGYLRREDHSPLGADLPVTSLRLKRGDETLAEIDVTAEPNLRDSHLVLDPDEGNWGAVTDSDGSAHRPFCRVGSVYHKAPFSFAVSSVRFAAMIDPAEELELELGYLDREPAPLFARLILPDAGGTLHAAVGNRGSGEWVDTALPLRREAEKGAETEDRQAPRYGVQKISIDRVEFVDGSGEERHIFPVGGTLRIRLHYSVNDPAFHERAFIGIAFLKGGVTRTHRLVLEDKTFDGTNEPRGVIEAEMAPIRVTPGPYAINVMVRKAGTYQNHSQTFYTANPDIYDLHSRAYEILIEGPPGHPLIDNVAFVHPVTWREREAEISSPDVGDLPALDGEPGRA